jgi:hypothetical protein
MRDDRGNDFCEKCGKSIKSTTYKVNGQKLCHPCFDVKVPDKEISTNVDNFVPYFDNSLGIYITSVRQKVKLLEKKGLHYSEDNPAFREKRKLAESYLGKDGRRQLDGKAKKEFTAITQNMARRRYEY